MIISVQVALYDGGAFYVAHKDNSRDEETDEFVNPRELTMITYAQVS